MPLWHRWYLGQCRVRHQRPPWNRCPMRCQTVDRIRRVAYQRWWSIRCLSSGALLFASLLAKEYFFGIRNGCLLLISILASKKLGPPLTLATLCLYPPPPFLLLRVFDGVTLGGPWRYWLQLLFFRRSFPCQLLKLWLFRRFPRPFACWFPFCILKCGCSSKHRLMVCVLLPQWVHRLLVRSFFFLQYSTLVWPPTCCSSNSV